MGILDRNLFSVPEPTVDINEALANRSEPTRVAVNKDAYLGFGIHFYITKQGRCIVRFDLPPAHDLSGFPEKIGLFLYKLTNAHCNELIYNSFYELLGECPFTQDTMEQWHSHIAANSRPPAGPIVKPGQALHNA